MNKDERPDDLDRLLIEAVSTGGLSLEDAALIRQYADKKADRLARDIEQGLRERGITIQQTERGPVIVWNGRILSPPKEK